MGRGAGRGVVLGNCPEMYTCASPGSFVLFCYFVFFVCVRVSRFCWGKTFGNVSPEMACTVRQVGRTKSILQCHSVEPHWGHSFVTSSFFRSDELCSPLQLP